MNAIWLILHLNKLITCTIHFFSLLSSTSCQFMVYPPCITEVKRYIYCSCLKFRDSISVLTVEFHSEQHNFPQNSEMVIHQFDNATAMPLCPRRPSLKTTTEIENYVSPPPPGPWPHPAASKPLYQLALIAAAFTLLNLQHAHLQAGPPEWANACATMYGKCRGTYCTCTIMRMHSCTHTLAHAVP